MYYSGALYVTATSFCKCDEIEWTGEKLNRRTDNECRVFRRKFIPTNSYRVRKRQSRAPKWDRVTVSADSTVNPFQMNFHAILSASLCRIARVGSRCYRRYKNPQRLNRQLIFPTLDSARTITIYQRGSTRWLVDMKYCEEKVELERPRKRQSREEEAQQSFLLSAWERG